MSSKHCSRISTDSQILLVCSYGKGRTEQNQINPALAPQTLGEQWRSFPLPSHWICCLCSAPAPWQSNPESIQPHPAPRHVFSASVGFNGFHSPRWFSSSGSSADSVLFKLQWEQQIRTPKANYRTTNKNQSTQASTPQLIMDIEWQKRHLNKHLHPCCGASPGRVTVTFLWRKKAETTQAGGKKPNPN